MVIEFNPKGLGSIINSSYAEKRLRNREATAVVVDNGDNPLQLLGQGPLLEVYSVVKKFDKQFPNARIAFTEHVCNAHSLPVDVQINSGPNLDLKV